MAVPYQTPTAHLTSRIIRGNPGDEADVDGTGASSFSHLKQLKEEIRTAKAEEERIAFQTEVAQNLLKVMSEDQACKEYYYDLWRCIDQ